MGKCIFCKCNAEVNGNICLACQRDIYCSQGGLSILDIKNYINKEYSGNRKEQLIKLCE